MAVVLAMMLVAQIAFFGGLAVVCAACTLVAVACIFLGGINLAIDIVRDIKRKLSR